MRIFLSILLLGALHAQAQDKTYAALQVNPQPLKQGQTITLNYKLAESTLKTENGEIVVVMFAYTRGKPVASDTLLVPGKKGFLQAKFILNDSTDAVAFNFLQGDANDANRENGYFFPVLNAAGAAIPETNLSMARLYRGEYLAGIENSKPDLVKKYTEAWLPYESKPNVAYMTKVEVALAARDTPAICTLVKDYATVAELTEANYNFLQSMNRSFCKDNNLAAGLQTALEAKHPNGDWRYKPWTDSLRKATAPSEKLVWYKAFKMANPQDAAQKIPFASRFVSEIGFAAARGYDLKTLDAMLPFFNATEPEAKAQVLNYAANLCVTKDTLLGQAEGLSRQALALIETEQKTGANRPPTRSKTTHKNALDNSFASYAGTYGKLLYKQAKYDSAFQYLYLAANQYKWADEGINQTCFEAMEKVKPAADVVKQIEVALKNDGGNDDIKAQYLRLAAVAGVANPQQQLDGIVAKADEKKFAKMKTRMINEKAPSFALLDLDGKTVSLESLKGKVVVVDFWATWCGPCISSFPGMQKVVAKYEKDENVKLLFVDTWQSEADKVATVKKFLADKPYTFHVLMDSKDEVVKSFNVNGIPTKFIIGKDGNIRFKSVGFDGSTEKTASEMQMMIELAKKG